MRSFFRQPTIIVAFAVVMALTIWHQNIPGKLMGTSGMLEITKGSWSLNGGVRLDRQTSYIDPSQGVATLNGSTFSLKVLEQTSQQLTLGGLDFLQVMDQLGNGFGECGIQEYILKRGRNILLGICTAADGGEVWKVEYTR